MDALAGLQVAVITVSMLGIAFILILSEGWVSEFHAWVQAKVAES